MNRPKVSGYQVALHLIMTGLATVVVTLVFENRSLRAAILRGPASPAPIARPVAGELLPSIDVTDLDGRELKLTFRDGDRDTMLLVFTTSCPACKGNLPRWQALQEELGERYHIKGVSLDPLPATQSYVDDQRLLFDVYVAKDPNGFRADYELPGVPETIHAGPDGRVLGSWLGILPDNFAERLTPEDTELATRPTDSEDSDPPTLSSNLEVF